MKLKAFGRSRQLEENGRQKFAFAASARHFEKWAHGSRRSPLELHVLFRLARPRRYEAKAASRKPETVSRDGDGTFVKIGGGNGS